MGSCPCGVTSSSRVSLGRHRKRCDIAILVEKVLALESRLLPMPATDVACVELPPKAWADLVAIARKLKEGVH